jgi:small subunit ribosomal protein S17
VKGKIPNKKNIVGTVVSDKTDKTVTISWETRKRHPLYKKFVKSHRKIKAHDESNQASVGDRVRIQQTRPISKEKSFRIVEILEKGQKE